MAHAVGATLFVGLEVCDARTVGVTPDPRTRGEIRWGRERLGPNLAPCVGHEDLAGPSRSGSFARLEKKAIFRRADQEGEASSAALVVRRSSFFVAMSKR